MNSVRRLALSAAVLMSFSMMDDAHATGIERARAFRQGLRGNTRVAVGTGHSLAILPGGQVVAWGENRFGQIGDGTGTDAPFPVKVYDLLNAIEVAAGFDHSLALLADGQVWAWGRNDEGQLGDKSFQDRWTPVPVFVPCSTGVVTIAAGGAHSLALCDDGSLWAWGRGAEGQIGDDNWSECPGPCQVSLDGAIRVAAGAYHSLAVLADGAIATWGANDAGQLGDGTYSPAGSPLFPGLDRVVMVAGGERHSLALLADGQMAAWGSNDWGQLGNKSFEESRWPVFPETDPMIAISAGGNHSIAVRMDGTLMAWGWDIDSGSIAVPTEVGLDRPVTEVAAGAERYFTVDGYGNTWAWGHLGFGVDAYVPELISYSDLGRIVADAKHFRMQAIRPDGTLWEWGDVGRRTKLPSRSTTIPAIKAMAVGFDHELALRVDGTVWSRGQNSRGQLGDGTLSPRSHFIRVEGLDGIVAIDASDGYSMALRADGTLWAWGSNRSGQVGDGTHDDALTPVQVLVPKETVAFAAGSEHALAVTVDGTTWSWGYNGSFQLGDGTTTSRSSPERLADLPCLAVEVAAGASHSLALCPGARAFAWGANHAGRGSDVPAEVGDLDIVKVAAGLEHSLAIRADGMAVAWGANSAGQLGDDSYDDHEYLTEVLALENAVDIMGGTLFSAAVRGDGGIVSWGSNYWGELGDGTLNPRQGPGAPIQVRRHHFDLAAGSKHAVAIGPFDELWAWGDNTSGYLGRCTTPAPCVPSNEPGLIIFSSMPSQVSSVSAGKDHSLAVRIDGTLWSWGSNLEEQLGYPTVGTQHEPGKVSNLHDVLAAAAGPLHSLAVLVDGSVYAWGKTLIGSSGSNPTYTWLTYPTQITTLDNVVAVAAGSSHSLALRNDGVVMAWGRNNLGQLGIGPGVSPLEVDPVPVDVPCDVTAISTMNDHSLALCTSGDVYAWGANGSWQLGYQSPPIGWSPQQVANLTSPVVAISAGDDHSMALYSSGVVVAWGGNSKGQIGDGTGTDRYQPTTSASISPNPPMVNVGAITAGEKFSLSSTWSGPSFAWGDESNGKFGTGALVPNPRRPSPNLLLLP
ncbi:MAG TPA: RCC1 repeat-containing protein [Vulgatibacter sp.]|nr:RCC1 repeat-containing protein [Vulgatibacter sp.]